MKLEIKHLNFGLISIWGIILMTWFLGKLTFSHGLGDLSILS